jgi:hypothetical protein
MKKSTLAIASAEDPALLVLDGAALCGRPADNSPTTPSDDTGQRGDEPGSRVAALPHRGEAVA